MSGSLLMKYTFFFASLDEINVLLNPKMWISSIMFKNTIQMSTLQFYDKKG